MSVFFSRKQCVVNAHHAIFLWGNTPWSNSTNKPSDDAYWGRSRKGRWVVKRKTAKDRFSRALRAVGQWCRVHRHRSLPEQHAALSHKLRGHYAYYGITGNARALARFRHEVRRCWCKWLGRRGGRKRMTWSRYLHVLSAFPLPPVRVVHSVYR